MAVVLHLPRDINRFCRACMNITDNTTNCFDNYMIKNNQQTELCRMFESVTSLNITEEDGLPETVCHRCTEQITALYTFRSQCHNVDKQLRSLKTLTDTSDKVEGSSDVHSTKTVSDHEMETNIKCDICHNIFSSSYELSMHMIEHNKHHNLSERFFSNQKNDLAGTPKKILNISTNVLKLIKTRKSEACGNFSFLKTLNDKDNAVNMKQEDIDTSIKSTLNEFQCDANKTNFRTNSNLVIIQCKMCLRKFNTRKELISHICKPASSQDSDMNNVCTTCSLCATVFPNPSILSLHVLKHALIASSILDFSFDTEVIFCEVCGQICEGEFDLEQHYDEKHGGKPPELCVRCCQTFNNIEMLVNHNCLLAEKYPPVPEDVLCVLCNITFTSKESLLKHSLEHLMKKYPCKKCSLSFSTKDSYFAHLTSHAGYRYDCPTCGKPLSTKSALKSHIVGVHSNELHHTCKTCGKSFATSGRLKIHSQIHMNHKKYVCSYCGYSAHKAGDLQMHVRVHTSERPYKCSFSNCNASFKTSSHLCEHVRRHLRIKKFKCNICGSGFSSSNGLKIHQMQHTGEKPFSCPVCNARFRRKYHVKVHMRQHEGKPR